MILEGCVRKFFKSVEIFQIFPLFRHFLFGFGINTSKGQNPFNNNISKHKTFNKAPYFFTNERDVYPLKFTRRCGEMAVNYFEKYRRSFSRSLLKGTDI